MSGISINQILSEFIKMGDTPIHNAIISLIFTSGLKPSIFRDFRIKDFLKACEGYFDKKEMHDIVTLLDKDPSQIFCCWEISNDSKYQVTFSTPETTEYIFKYLKQVLDVKNLGKDDYLFQIKNGNEFVKIREEYVSDIIGRKSENYNSQFASQHHNIHLTPKKIIDNFKTICKEHLDLNDDKPELINLFLGKATNNNKFYKMYLEDKNSILTYYKQLVPYLEIDYQHEMTSIENDSEIGLKSIVTDYFSGIFIDKNDYESFFKWRDIGYNIAKKDYENSNFKESPEYFNELYKKTYLRVFFSDYEFSTKIKEEDMYKEVSNIISYLDDIDFFTKFRVNKDEFHGCLNDCVECCGHEDMVLDLDFIITFIEMNFIIDNNLRIIICE